MGVHRDRKTEILYEAAQLFVKKGYRAASLQEIAECFGFSTPALYHYFSSKEQLLYEILTYALDVNEQTRARVAESTTDAAQHLRELVRAELLDITTREVDGEFSILLVQEANELAPDHRHEVTRRRRAHFDHHRAILDELKSQGRLRDVDTTVATFCLLAMITTVATWFQRDGRLSGEQLAEEMTTLASGLLLDDEPAVPTIAEALTPPVPGLSAPAGDE